MILESKVFELSVEQKANSQENASILLFDRLSNQNIKKQFLDLMCEYEAWAEKNVVHQIPFKKENGEWNRDANGKMIFSQISYKAETREQIEEKYDKTLERVKSFTEFEYSSEEPHGGDSEENERMYLDWRLPLGNKPNAQQWGMIEAHEKGHSMRPYPGKFFRDYFAKAFDLSVVSFTDKEYQEILRLREVNDKQVEEKDDLNFDEHKEAFFDYLFSGTEVAERMSQLKNYFGLRGDELFTLEQLRYAKEHYVIDTGLDNRMTPFLKAVTPETEAEFVRLINCSGI